MRKSGSLEHYADFANLSCKYSVKWWYATTFFYICKKIEYELGRDI